MLRLRTANRFISLYKQNNIRLLSNDYTSKLIRELSISGDVEDINNVLSSNNLKPEYIIDNNHTVLRNAIKYNKIKLTLYYLPLNSDQDMTKFLISNCPQIINEASYELLCILLNRYNGFATYLHDNKIIMSKLTSNKLPHKYVYDNIIFGIILWTSVALYIVMIVKSDMPDC